MYIIKKSLKRLANVNMECRLLQKTLCYKCMEAHWREWNNRDLVVLEMSEFCNTESKVTIHKHWAMLFLIRAWVNN